MAYYFFAFQFRYANTAFVIVSYVFLQNFRTSCLRICSDVLLKKEWWMRKQYS